MESPEFGRVLFFEISATCVGRIEHVFIRHIEKGSEGLFVWSCVATLFEKGAISFDPDLLEYSQGD